LFAIAAILRESVAIGKRTSKPRHHCGILNTNPANSRTVSSEESHRTCDSARSCGMLHVAQKLHLTLLLAIHHLVGIAIYQTHAELSSPLFHSACAAFLVLCRRVGLPPQEVCAMSAPTPSNHRHHLHHPVVLWLLAIIAGLLALLLWTTPIAG